MEIDQIKELMKHLEGSKLSKLALKKGDFELQLEKEGAVVAVMPKRSAHTEPHFEPAHQPHEMPHKPEKKAAAAEEAPGAFVTSPMVGTFYGSPAPDQASFVKVGDKVSENTIVCIIEAMKVMNEVKAGISGTVAEILADNAQPVEFGSKLLRIV